MEYTQINTHNIERDPWLIFLRIDLYFSRHRYSHLLVCVVAVIHVVSSERPFTGKTLERSKGQSKFWGIDRNSCNVHYRLRRCPLLLSEKGPVSGRCRGDRYLLPLAGWVAVTRRLGVALSTGGVFELGASEAIQERVVPLGCGVHSVRHPVSQHEEEVREPRGSAGGSKSTKWLHWELTRGRTKFNSQYM